MNNDRTPMETGCTTVELPDEGTTNAVLNMVSGFRPIAYDEEADVYRVEYDE